MEKNFNLSFKRSSEKLIDHIVSKVKMVKQGTLIYSQNEENSKNEPEKEGKSMLKISSENIATICEQLEQFIDYIENATKYIIHNYSAVLEKRLKNSVEELEHMLREIKSVHMNIQKQKMQQKCVNKEKNSMEKTLNKLKDNEIREMEIIISLFDKQMYHRWESVKSTRKPETLEGLLTDIKNKQLALGNLETLVSRKLTNLNIIPTLNNSADNSKNKVISNPIALPFLPLELESLENITIPPPPPLPPISPPIPPPMPSLMSSLMYDSNISSMRSRQRSQIDKRRRIENE